MGRMVDKDKAFRDLEDQHDKDLWEAQEQHMKLALHHALQTDVSKAIYQQHKNSPKGIWNHLVNHYSSTESSRAQSKKIIDKLQNLNIKEYDTRVEFGTKLTQLISQHDDVSTESLSSNNSIAYFENGIASDPAVTSHFNSWKTSFKLTKNADPVFNDYKKEMLNFLPNIDLQQPRRGKVSTRSINLMNQHNEYDSDDDLDAVYNILLTQFDNIDESTSVDIMRALRKTGRPV